MIGSPKKNNGTEQNGKIFDSIKTTTTTTKVIVETIKDVGNGVFVFYIYSSNPNMLVGWKKK
ncbi:hypothetical protein DERF_001160 [Dermatophagoides farinae]|uniref:Uncharacterized protein n=1 Tax=Dermatophagoides farinae TaxID=6954 RepID=A0A922IAB0_DERFA|nr:hypothetical protein DERF_001160 [Dermatophagoides farinae]